MSSSPSHFTGRGQPRDGFQMVHLIGADPAWNICRTARSCRSPWSTRASIQELVHDDHSLDPDGARLDGFSWSTGMKNSSGKQPPDGPPVCTALYSFRPEFLHRVVDDLAGVMPIGTSTSPVLICGPRRVFHRPFAFSVPIFAYQVAIPDDGRNVGVGLNIVD